MHSFRIASTYNVFIRQQIFHDFKRLVTGKSQRVACGTSKGKGQKSGGKMSNSLRDRGIVQECLRTWSSSASIGVRASLLGSSKRLPGRVGGTILAKLCSWYETGRKRDLKRTCVESKGHGSRVMCKFASILCIVCVLEFYVCQFVLVSVLQSDLDISLPVRLWHTPSHPCPRLSRAPKPPSELRRP